MISNPTLTDKEKANLKQWNVTPKEVIRCGECNKLAYIASEACRYCGESLESEEELLDQETCPTCEQPSFYDELNEEYYCPACETSEPKGILDY